MPSCPRRLRTFAMASALICARPATACADPSSAAAPASSDSALWGWTIVAVSTLIGGTITGVSLTVECPHDDLECARWTSLGIWGGIGVASLGATIGLLFVRAASRPARVRTSFTVRDPQRGPPMPTATLLVEF